MNQYKNYVGFNKSLRVILFKMIIVSSYAVKELKETIY